MKTVENTARSIQAPPDTAAVSEAPPATLSDRRLLPLGVALMLAVALVAFEGLSVAPALPEIGADLGNIGGLPWVVTAYLFCSALAIAVTGSIVDAVGSRTVFRTATITFALSCLGCALAPSLGTLITARLLQGTAGGALMATVGAAVGLGYPDGLRSRVYALSATVWGVLSFGGPALAGFLLAVASWRWIFLVSVPPALLAAAAGWSTLPGAESESRGSTGGLSSGAAAAPKPAERFDTVGALLVATLTAILLVGFSRLEATSLLVIGAALVLAALYAVHARRHPSPVLAARHTVGPPFRQLALAAGAATAAGLGIETYLPLYLRGARGLSVGLAATSVLFLTVGWTTGANVASRLYGRRLSEPAVIQVGALTTLLGILAASATVGLGWPLVPLLAAYVVIGLGIGATTNACLTLAQRAAVRREIGRATAAHQFLRSLAITLGTALAGAILLAVATHRLGDPERVRHALDRADIALDATAAAAIGQGFLLAHGLALVLALLAALAARSLRRLPTMTQET